MNSAKKILTICLVLACITPACHKKSTPVEETSDLKILSMAPQGDNLPIATEGISVMFNQAMVPLTTLDQNRAQSIPIKIIPDIEGKFHWLGTRGFIFRPEQPFDPATQYTVTLPDSIQSLAGKKLGQATQWSFSTVIPRVTNNIPENTPLMPSHAKVAVVFNLSMDTSDVESKIRFLVNQKESNLGAKYSWEDKNHVLLIQFKNSLPWDSTFSVLMPEGLKSQTGALPSQEATEFKYKTPPQNLALDYLAYDSCYEQPEADLISGKEITTTASKGICFCFNQPIVRSSFEKSFFVKWNDSLTTPKFNPFFRYSNRDYFEAPSDLPEEDNPYDSVCAYFLDEYNRAYSFGLDPKNLAAFSGAKADLKQPHYLLRTLHAQPELKSTLTKGILSADAPIVLPYRYTNIKNLTLRVYPLESRTQYSESIKNETLTAKAYYDAKLQIDIPDVPYVTRALFPTDLALPIASNLRTIDQLRMPASQKLTLPLEGSWDQSHKVMANLESLKLKPGLYLIEAFGDAGEGKAQSTAVLTMIQITPLGIALKQEVDHAMAWVTDIESGKPRAGVAVNLMMISSRKIIYQETLTTNADGVAISKHNWESYNDKDGGRYLCAEITSPYSYSCLQDHSLGYNSTLSSGKKYFAHLQTDRPIYRPGQKVYFSSFVRENKESRYFMPEAKTQVAIRAIDSSGAVIFNKQDQPLEAGGVIQGSFDLDDSPKIPRGTYTLELKIDDQTSTQTFSVSSYKKPSFKVEVQSTQKEIISKTPLDAEVTGSYFFGAPLAQAKTRINFITQPYWFYADQFEDYKFTDPDDYARQGLLDTDLNSKEPLQLDAEGKLAVNYTPDISRSSRSVELTIEAAVQDPSHEEVAAFADLIVHKADFYVGLKTDKWVYGEKEKATIHLATVKTDEQIAPSKSVKITFLKRDYKFVEERDAQGFWDFSFVPKDEIILTKEVKTDSEGLATIEVDIPQGGTYRVVASGSDGKNTLQNSALEIYAWGQNYVPWKLGDVQTLELIPDKTSYKIGETAHVLVKSLVPPTKALLTLERGGVLDYQLIELGDSNASHIDIPITEGLIPNIYMNVLAHVGRDDQRPPMLFKGKCELIVERNQKQIALSIDYDKKSLDGPLPVYKPGETVTATIKATNPAGEPLKTHLIVSVADESVLRLLNYQLPDLIEEFYYSRYHSVMTSSSLVSLKAGDGGPADSRKRRNFKDTAFFQGHLTTNEEGLATFSFQLPDDLTTWVTDVLAISESKTAQDFEDERKVAQTTAGQQSLQTNLALTDATLVGSARSKIMSTLPLTLRPALPRFAAWGDQLVARVIANNQNPTAIKGTLTAKVTGDATLDNPAKAQNIPFQIPANSEKAFDIKLAIQKPVAQNFVFEAQAQDSQGAFIDGFEKTVPVTDRYAPEQVATSGTTKSKTKEQIVLPESIETDRSTLQVEAKASLAVALAGSLKELINYPYSCSEQQSASLLALLMAHDFVDQLGENYFDLVAPLTKDEISKLSSLSQKKNILIQRAQGIIDDIQSHFIAEGGGVKYWPESRQASLFPSLQTLVALQKAKDKNLSVDMKIFNEILSYAKLQLAWSEATQDMRAYGAWVRSLILDFDDASNADLVKQKDKLSTAGLSYLLVALAARPGNETNINQVKNRLIALSQQEPRHTSWPASDFFAGSVIKNTSLAVWALIKTDATNPLIERGMAFLLNRKKSEPFALTQDPLALAFAVSALAQKNDEFKTDFSALLNLGEKEILKAKFNKNNLLIPQSKIISLADLPNGDLLIQKEGEGTLYYDLVLKYYLPPDQTPPREEGLMISRDYFELNDVAESKPLATFDVGKNYKAHITLLVPQYMNTILVQDLLPAGFEPIDMTLATSSLAAAHQAAQGAEARTQSGGSGYDDDISVPDYGMDFGFEHQEIHDDAIIWSGTGLPAGVYHIRYPIRAVTVGTFYRPGAEAFDFYEPEIFGRSKPRLIEIKAGD